MPFKSKKQAAKIAQLENEGKLKRGTFAKWKAETPSMGKLPERAPGKASKVKKVKVIK